MKIFRYKEDRLPFLIWTGVFLVDLLIYLYCQSPFLLIAWTLLTIVPKSCSGAWNHHHQHLPFFYSTPLNRFIEFIFTLQTGMTTHAWTLHHVLGHHLNYLDQHRDESKWMRNDGSTMDVITYTIMTALTGYTRAFGVGLKHRKYLPAMIGMGLFSFTVLAILVYFKPLAATIVFIIPMLYTYVHTCYATYEHHAGLDTEDPHLGSYNISHKWYNRLTGNLGYHTAHHIKPGLHWSKLPELHKKIEPKIPAELYREPKALMRLLPNK